MSLSRVSKLLQLTSGQKESIQRLIQEFRNNFVHYLPGGWSIEISIMSQIAKEVHDVIRFLALDSGNCILLAEHGKKKVETLVTKSKKLIK